MLEKKHSRNWQDGKEALMDSDETARCESHCGLCSRKGPRNTENFPYTSIKYDEDVCTRCWKNECKESSEIADKLLAKLPPAA